MRSVFCLLLTLFFVSGAQAQEEKKTETPEAVSPLKRADALSVRSNLENMLVRRYTQELSAFVSSDAFKVGARFELKVVEKATESDSIDMSSLGYSDLDLGYLDPDELLDAYSLNDLSGINPLEKYAIKSVDIQVGLEPNMTEEVKTSVEKWVTARVQEEFGTAGKAKVQFIQNPELSGQTSSPFMKMIKEMQGLVGNIILGLCILFGILLWKVLAGKSSDAAAAGAGAAPSVSIQSKTEAAITGGVGGVNPEESAALEQSYKDQIDQLSLQIKDLSPKIVDHVESLIHEWCEKGEEGLNQLACFAEISGSVLGSMPIPEEQKKKMGAVFSQMHMMDSERRFNIVNKVYWDMVASLNLGAEALHRPFSFINNSGLGKVNKVLLGNDIDTQTVVTMYMPETMRKSYFKELGQDQKIDLLKSAAQLSAISEDQLKGIEDQIAPYFSDKETEESSVSMSLTLTKLIDAMPLLDACKLLPSVEGPVIEQFKQAEPHIAFLPEWNKESLSLLARQVSNEQLLAYLRVVPDMKHYFLEYVSPRVSQILKDDLEQPDSMQDAEKEQHLASFNSLIMRLVSSGEINFYETMKKDDTQGLQIAA